MGDPCAGAACVVAAAGDSGTPGQVGSGTGVGEAVGGWLRTPARGALAGGRELP
jgi:hypothetical protein